VRRRLATVPDVVQDALLAVVLAAVAISSVSIVAHQHDDPNEHAPALAIVLLLVGHLPLAARRRFPVAVWLVTGTAACIYGMAPYVDPPLPFGALLGVYTVAAHAPRRTAVWAAVATALFIAGSLATRWADASLGDWFNAFVTVGAAWLLGAYTVELRDRATKQARQATADERLRIARELHDIAAHQVSVIAIQAEAGQALLPHQPERAATVLATIGDAAREALTELRRLLGVLRDVDRDATTEKTATTAVATAATREPQPGLDDLDDLVNRVRDAGVTVDLTIEGRRDPPLPDGVDLSAYRIVQEALTNVLKHAGTARAQVVVRYLPRRLDLEICDDGRGATRTNGGHGLVGMRERVDLLGGELTAGNRPGGGFAVSARLPR
jgi:signal transduction histidine kinase